MARVSPDENGITDILEILNHNIPHDRVWLRQENMILHVACRTIDDASKLLKIARDTGFRRSGIIADSNIIMVEICSTEKMDVPLSEDGKILVDDNYIRTVIGIANKKFLKGKEKLKKFESDLKKIQTKIFT